MSDPLPLQLKAERLDRIVGECLASAAPALAQRALSLTRQIAPDLPDHPLDAALMKEAVECLIGEAIARASGGSRLRVTVKASRNALMFSVKSPGAGLPDAEREALFTREPLPGSPARARAIVAAHGGVTWANGAPGKGMTYYVSLPLRQPRHPQS